MYNYTYSKAGDPSIDRTHSCLYYICWYSKVKVKAYYYMWVCPQICMF